MGIPNVTPDSFSDGGCWSSSDAVIEYATQMTDEGADFIDTGGESVRSNSTRVSEKGEWSRISTVLRVLADQGVMRSADTLHAAIALGAANAGTAIINDVSGGRWDPQTDAVFVKTDLAYAAQHYRVLPRIPGESPDHDGGLMGMLKGRINAQVRDALDAGVVPEAVVIDSGFGFSLANKQCRTVFGGPGILSPPGYPVLIGTLRKRFITAVDGDRDEQISIVTRHCACEGTRVVRIHGMRGNARMTCEGNEVGR